MCNPDRFPDTAGYRGGADGPSEHRTGQNQVGAVTPLTTEQASAPAMSKPGPLLLLTQAGQRAGRTCELANFRQPSGGDPRAVFIYRVTPPARTIFLGASCEVLVDRQGGG